MKQVALVAVVSAMLIASAPPLAAQERWSIATSSTGSGPYIIGTAIAQVVNERESKVILSAQTSGGYNENLMLVAQGKVNSGLTLMADLRDAYAGEGVFAEIPNAKQTFSRLRRMFPVTTATFHCAVRADSGIRSFADLKGKKLNINVPATSTQRINRAMLAAMGNKPTDFTIFEIATSKSFSSLGDRIVDATCNGLPMPGSPLMQLAASTPVNLLSIPDDAFERLNKTYSGTMLRVTIPANTYPGQTADVKTFAYPETLFVRDDAKEQDVYLITKAYWEGPQPNNPAFKQITLQNAALEVDPPLHAGAARYLRERGLIK